MTAFTEIRHRKGGAVEVLPPTVGPKGGQKAKPNGNGNGRKSKGQFASGKKAEKALPTIEIGKAGPKHSPSATRLKAAIRGASGTLVLVYGTNLSEMGFAVAEAKNLLLAEQGKATAGASA
jgi:hypothetical protein